MSMSMPSTCTRDAASVPHKGARNARTARACAPVLCQQQLIPRLLLPVNDAHLRRYCHDSLTRICHEYSVTQDSPVMRGVRESVSVLSFTKALALFFLLLNIDTGLKQALMESELKQQDKCVNFFMNLRKHIVPEFMSNETSDATHFTQRCEDAWTVA